MAIYYIDPHSTTTGTGTYASPWTLNNTTRTGLTSGDELRIKGVALTSLLTATVYTATYTSQYQLTITAGGGLGADFAVNDICYLPGADTFFKVAAVAANVVSVSSTIMLPWYDTSSGQTTITVRRVDLTTYPAGANGTSYLVGNSSLNNITVTDCWTSATTRVTDGTVKTLINNSGTFTSVNFYLENSTVPTIINTNTVYDLTNTHFLPPNSANGYLVFNIFASNVTATIGQVFANNLSTTTTYGASTYTSENVTVTYKHLNNQAIISGGNCKNLNITVNNIVCYYASYIYGTSSIRNILGLTITINNLTFFNYVNTCIAGNNTTYLNTTITYTGTLDCYSNVTMPAVYNGYGNVVINFGAGFNVKYNRRLSTNTTTQYLLAYITSTVAAALYIPAINTPTGFTVTTTPYTYTAGTAEITTDSFVPVQATISAPQSAPAAYNITGNVGYANTLITFRNGNAPLEVLGFYGSKNSAGSPAYASSVVVTTDATVFRTTGPSLKADLNTYNTSFWNNAASTKVTKTIKVPVTAGVAKTITGYVRTNQTIFLNGDCTMRAYFNSVQLASQAMTTACINAWEQFTLTFTPTYTGEVILAMNMYFSAGAKSYWLDDVTV